MELSHIIHNLLLNVGLVVYRNKYELCFDNIKNTTLIFTSNEFGIIWTAPCIAIAILICVVQLFKKRDVMINLISLLMFLQVFSVVLIWSTTASSYGYRYLYS